MRSRTSRKAIEAEPAIPAALAAAKGERKPVVKKLVTAARTSADWYENISPNT